MFVRGYDESTFCLLGVNRALVDKLRKVVLRASWKRHRCSGLTVSRISDDSE